MLKITLMYGIYLTIAAAVLLVYVTWRLSSLPWLNQLPRWLFQGSGLILGLILLVGRSLERKTPTSFSSLLEFLSMSLVGTLFLIFICLFPIDLLQRWVRFSSSWAARLRALAILTGCLMAMLALFQGLRPPLIVDYEIHLPGLPTTFDGTKIAAISDLHLGTQMTPSWLAARVTQIQSLRPDMIVLLGDTFEGHGASVDAFLSELQHLSAPLGVWSVDGNHESHGENSTDTDSPFNFSVRTLRDEVVTVVPGLSLAGRRARPRHPQSPISAEWNPDKEHLTGAMILLAHMPTQTEFAARAGVGLMLSGHTHGGQLWPISYLTRIVNPFLAGRYTVKNMTLLVSRGAGTWGPRMRLWQPGEIMLITLRAKKACP